MVVKQPEGFISPMLASSMPKVPLELSSGQYAVEEKFDGHRLIVTVREGQRVSLYDEGNVVTAWGRYGIERILPQHLIDALSQFPLGTYDGELLVPGKRSYGVTELVNGADLVYTMFDVLRLEDVDAMGTSYDVRRECLRRIMDTVAPPRAVKLASSTIVTSDTQLVEMAHAVWARDGEGLILKRRTDIYSPGKRSKGWVKIKQLRTAVLTIIGFEPSRGQIQNRGPYATVVLKDDEGNVTTVKTLNDAELEKFAKQAVAGKPHPALGRQLRIEFQERTPDGLYRHPRWDRFEDE